MSLSDTDIQALTLEEKLKEEGKKLHAEAQRDANEMLQVAFDAAKSATQLRAFLGKNGATSLWKNAAKCEYLLSEITHYLSNECGEENLS